MWLSARLAARELRSGVRGFRIFLACLALGVAAIAAVVGLYYAALSSKNGAAWAPLIPPQTLLVSLIKGIELGSLKRMSEVIMETLDVPPHRVAVVSGPDRGEQHVVRLTDAPPIGAGEAQDMGPARGMRPLEHGLARAL